MLYEKPEVYGLSVRGDAHPVNHDHFAIAALVKAMRVQQSNLPVADGEDRGQNQGHVFLVADGVGGGPDPAHASGHVVESVTQFMLSEAVWHDLTDGNEATVRRTLEDAIVHAQTDLVRDSAAEDLHPGTTLTMAFVAWPDLYVAHVGDSRCYLHRNGRATQLTTDHTVARPSRQRGIDPSLGDAQRLWNAVGGPSRELHLEVRHETLEPGDLLALVTDGVVEGRPGVDPRTILDPERSPEEMCFDLTEGRCEDDRTAIVARFDPYRHGTAGSLRDPLPWLDASAPEPAPPTTSDARSESSATGLARQTG